MSNTVTKIAPASIPSSYASLGVTSGYNPRKAEDLRLFIIGPSGQGKSTFVCGIPDTLILDMEGGAEGVPNSKSARVTVKNYDHLVKVIDQLVADGKNGVRPFKRVVFDTVDQWAEMIALKLEEEKGVTEITEYGAQGAGWSLIRNRCWGQVQALESAGYTWACVGHITEKTVTMPDKSSLTVIRPALFDSFSRIIMRNCDVMTTIFSLTEAEPEMREIQGKLRKVGEKEIIRYYSDVQSTAPTDRRMGSGKYRGVPGMKSRLVLPDPMTGQHGWDVFAEAYMKAVDSVKVQLNQ